MSVGPDVVIAGGPKGQGEWPLARLDRSNFTPPLGGGGGFEGLVMLGWLGPSYTLLYNESKRRRGSQQILGNQLRDLLQITPAA